MSFGGRGVIGLEKFKLCELGPSIISKKYQKCLYKHSKNLFFLSTHKNWPTRHVPQDGNPCSIPVAFPLRDMFPRLGTLAIHNKNKIL
jgi:hypothetical protein